MRTPIFIVEDTVDAAEWLKRQLAEAGLCNPCHAVSSAAEAWAYIEGLGGVSVGSEHVFSEAQ